MPVAFRKGIFTWQLVATAEVPGSLEVSRIRPGVPKENLLWYAEVNY
jgi:hypothetical protein